MPSDYGMNYGTAVGRAVVKALGGQPTPEKMRFFQAWARAEGTKAQYNPFATTRKGFAGETNFNSVGVKNYPDLRTGIKATVDTLSLNYYTHIVDLLRKDDVTAEQLAAAVAKSPWGTGTGVLRVLGVTETDGYERAQSAATYGAAKGKVESYYQTVTLDRFRPSEAYMSFLETKGDVGAPALRAARGFQPFSIEEAVPTVEGGAEGPTAPSVPSGGPAAFTPSGKIMVLPSSFSGTHVTDNLGWNTKTAADIMGNPGTPVGAPEAGEIVRWGSAQGGQSLYLRGRSGAMYWIGHIDQMVPAGTKVKRGQYIAAISADHAAPHVHIDRQSPRRGK